MEQENSTSSIQPVNKSKVRLFIRVMLILAAVTALEYLIAFTVPHDYKMIRVTVFILLTLVKAFYIVVEFMHLGHEKKPLKWSIILPLFFVIFFIAIMIYQGGAIFNVLESR